MRQMKRQMAPKNWPIQRKGTTFVVKGDEKGVPILIALRDMLKISKNKPKVEEKKNE